MDHPLYQQAYQLIDSKHLGRIADQLKQSLKPAIRMDSSPVSGHPLPVGASKLGGLPDLPLSLAWPTWKGVPMVFLAQIQLQEVALYDLEHRLPSHGFLFFFCQSQGLAQAPDTKIWEYIDPYEHDSWRVLFFAGNATELRPTNAPPGLAPEALLPSCSLHCGTALMLPSEGGSVITSLHLAKEELKQYHELLADFDDMFLGRADHVLHHHWLLGYPMSTYHDPELLCQMASQHISPSQWNHLDEGTKKAIETDAREWVHLFFMDTDENAQVTWGEYGSLSYWIKRTDLSRHHFEACWAIEFSL
jgi:uncharacterized protein YwqG